MIGHYDWAGGRETMLRFGPDHGPVVIAAMPLLEEWSRTRTFMVALLRALARRRIASVLPDLPGHGESLRAVADMTISSLAEALQAVGGCLADEGRPTVGMAVRSGALLDHHPSHVARWHLAPTTGGDVLHDLHRTWLAGERRPANERSVDVLLRSVEGPITIAGTPLSNDFLSSLIVAEPVDQPGVARRIVRLASDPRPADLHVVGTPLWRQAEPGSDPALVEALADDLAAWIRACAE